MKNGDNVYKVFNSNGTHEHHTVCDEYSFISFSLVLLKISNRLKWKSNLKSQINFGPNL